MPSDVIGVTDIDEVFLVFGTHRIQGWPATGTFIQPTRVNPDEVSVEEGVDGNLALIKRKGNAVIVDVTLARESRSNTVLWGLLQAQRNAPGLVLLPLTYSHKSTKMASARACIMTAPAGAPVGDGPQTMLWRLLCASFDGVMTGLAIDGVP